MGNLLFKGREGISSLFSSLSIYLQVYYHLGAFEESLTYALGAGNLFNVNDTSEYVETTIGL